MNTPDVVPPSYEFALSTFVQSLKFQGTGDKPKVWVFIEENMEKLVHVYIHEKLEDCSDLKYRPDLAKALIAGEDFSDLIARANDYDVCKHMRSVIRAYVSEVNRARPIKVTDRAKFGVSMEYLGINIGGSAESTSGGRSVVPDGNMLVLSVMTVIIVALLTLRK